MLREESYLLCALRGLGELSIGQLSRFLSGSGVPAEADLKPFLASLKERGLICQTVNLSGIVYGATEAGLALMGEEEGFAGMEEELAAQCEEFRRLFRREKNYLAQYTEQSSGVVPVFLSIRDGDKIVLKISVNVRNVDTAKKICAGWMKNSGRAYDAICQAIAADDPDALLWPNRPGEEEA